MAPTLSKLPGEDGAPKNESSTSSSTSGVNLPPAGCTRGGRRFAPNRDGNDTEGDVQQEDEPSPDNAEAEPHSEPSGPPNDAEEDQPTTPLRNQPLISSPTSSTRLSPRKRTTTTRLTYSLGGSSLPTSGKKKSLPSARERRRKAQERKSPRSRPPKKRGPQSSDDDSDFSENETRKQPPLKKSTTKKQKMQTAQSSKPSKKRKLRDFQAINDAKKRRKERGQFFATATNQVLEQFKANFYLALVGNENAKKGNKQMISREQYEFMVEVLRNPDGSRHHMKYKWLSKYMVVEINEGGTDKYVIMTQADNIEDAKKVCMYDELWQALLKEHQEDHVAARNLHQRVSQKWSNIPRDVCSVFCNCCPICNERAVPGRKPTTATTPIITHGTFSHMQIDLVYFQNIAVSGSNALMSLFDHSSKLEWSTPLCGKTQMDVVGELFVIFNIIGAPKVLQPDNGPEFGKIGLLKDQGCSPIEMSDEVRTSLIFCILYLLLMVNIILPS